MFLYNVYIRLKIKPNIVRIRFWFFFHPRWDSNSHHWYTGSPI